MTAEMKWYIFDEENHPVCWGDDEGNEPACEFDTKEDAQAFLDGIMDLDPFIMAEFAMATISECIFFYDGGKVNMSGLRPVMEDHEDIKLERWRD